MIISQSVLATRIIFGISAQQLRNSQSHLKNDYNITQQARLIEPEGDDSLPGQEEAARGELET